jgi:hypothetical protein
MEETMKRDMKLVKKILLEIEKKYKPGGGKIVDIDIDGYDYYTVAEHCDLLYQAGYIKRYKPSYASGQLVLFAVGNMTNSGYDFLDSIRDVRVKMN